MGLPAEIPPGSPGGHLRLVPPPGTPGGGAPNNIIEFPPGGRKFPPDSKPPAKPPNPFRLPPSTARNLMGAKAAMKGDMVPGIPFSTAQFLDPMLACELGLGPCGHNPAMPPEPPFRGGQMNVLYNVHIREEWFDSKGKPYNDIRFYTQPNILGPIKGLGTFESNNGNGAYGIIHGNPETINFLRLNYAVKIAWPRPEFTAYCTLKITKVTRSDNLPDISGDPPPLPQTPPKYLNTSNAPPAIAPPDTDTPKIPETAPPHRNPDEDGENDIKPFKRPPKPAEPEPAEPPAEPEPQSPPEPNNPPEPDTEPPYKPATPPTPQPPEPLIEPPIPGSPRPKEADPDKKPKGDPPIPAPEFNPVPPPYFVPGFFPYSPPPFDPYLNPNPSPYPNFPGFLGVAPTPTPIPTPIPTATAPAVAPSRPARAKRDRAKALALYRRAEGRRAEQDVDGAIELYLAAEAADPRLPEVQKKLALCYQLKGDTRRAAERYRRYLATDPDDADRVRAILPTLR